MKKELKIYRGVRKADKSSKGNEGQIWVERRDGMFYCEILNMVLNRKQIESDVKNGYLKEVKRPA